MNRKQMLLAAAAAALLLLSAFLAVWPQEESSLQIRNGVLQIRDDIPPELLRLEGEWAYYPGRLLEAEEILNELHHADPISVRVPHTWSEADQAESDVATYALRVRNAPSGEHLALRIGNGASAYRVYIDGALVAASGEVERTGGSERAASVPQTAAFTVSQRDFHLIVQVRRESDGMGGLWFPIQFGLERDALRIDTAIVVKEAALAGAMLMMGLYYFCFYLVVRKDRLNLLLSLGCLLIVLRIAALGERTFIRLLPEMPAQTLSMFSHLVDVWSPLPFLLLIRGLFPTESKDWPIRIYAGCAGAFSIVMVFLPVSSLVMLSNAMYIVVFGAFAAGCAAVGKAILRGRPGALPHLIGFAAIVILGLHDMLDARMAIDSRFGELGSVGVAVLLAAQAFVLARRYERNSAEAERLSAELTVLNRQKDDFLASTSYELKMPLHGMIGIAETLSLGAEGPLAGRQRQQLELVAAAGRRLNHLIDDLLIYSRMKYENLPLQPVRIPAESIVRPIVDIHRQAAGGQGEAVEAVADVQSGLAVHADERMLAHILHNLVSVASKYAAGAISVSARGTDDDLAEFVIQAAGGALPEDAAKLLFASFEQIDRSFTGGDKEMSLGLPIARVLVERQGGRIELLVETERVPDGFAFRFTLPAASGAHGDGGRATDGDISRVRVDSEAAAASEFEYAEDRPGGEDVVLVVDDNPAIRQAIVNRLNLEGYSVASAADGAEAWGRILSHGDRLSLVIADMMTPSLSGFQLCRSIRERWTEVELPVLILSADHRRETMLAAFAAGTNDYMAKPFEAEEFRARVRMLVDIRRAMTKVKEAELAFLQAQIKPHFLYNTLSAIAACCAKDPNQARELIGDFATYLRRSFDTPRTESLVTVEAELELAEAYLNIEQARYGSRLRVEYRVDPDAERLRIPQLTIQPLAENAVRHGVMKRSEGGTIVIEVKKTDQMCRISVSDNGAGMTQERLAEVFSADAAPFTGRTGVGLRNIDGRLRSMFGSGLRFEGNAGCCVSFDIPLAAREPRTGGEGL